MNAAHLRSDRAADHILFDVWTIDGRFPTQDDSLSWPELLTRYDIKRVAGRYILMKKSVTPRHYELTPITETVAKFDEGICSLRASAAPGAVQPAAKVRGREHIYWHARFQRYTKIFCDSVVIEHSMSGWQFAYAMRFDGTQVLLPTRSEIIPWSEILPVMRNAFFSP